MLSPIKAFGNAFVYIRVFGKKLKKFYVLNHFDALISNNFLKIKIYHYDVFQYEKYFEKQSQPNF